MLRNEFDYFKNTSPILQQIKDALVKQYLQEHDFTFGSFLKFYQKVAEKHGIDLTTQDFFEHTILHAARYMDSSTTVNGDKSLCGLYREMLTLQCSPNSHGLVKNFSLMSLYCNLDRSKSHAWNEYDRSVDVVATFFGAVVDVIRDCLSRIDPDFVVDGGPVVGKNSYGFVLKLEAAAKVFIQNPMLTAEYLIEHDEELPDVAEKRQLAKRLIEELSKFKKLQNGLSDAVLDNLITRLNVLVMSYQFADSAGLGTFGTFAQAAPNARDRQDADLVVDAGAVRPRPGYGGM